MKTLALRAPINEPNSYGGNARALAVACHRAGVPVRTIDCPSGLWRNHILELEKEEAEILKALATTPLRGGDYALVQHVVPNQFVYDPSAFANVGYTLFETSGIPPEWVLPLQAMEEVWCASTFNMRTFRDSGVRNNIRLVPHGVNTDWFKPGVTDGFDLELNPDDVVFGCCFDWTPRKNGINQIAAYLKALQGVKNAVLILKVYTKRQGIMELLKKAVKEMREKLEATEHPRIILAQEIIADCKMPAFYNKLDYLLSCTHGEGFNKPVLEAMACGVPSIVTGWSGHMDFCNSDNSIWIADTPMGYVQPEQVHECGAWYMNQKWVYPALAGIADGIRWAYEMHGTREMAALKAACIERAQSYSWDKIAGHIKEILDGNGSSK